MKKIQFMWVDEAALKEITDVIVETVNPERVILFGSRARGDAKENADVDLLVIVSEPFGEGRSRREMTVDVRKQLMHFFTPIDLLLYSHDEVEHWKRLPRHVVTIGLKEGRVLYELARTS